MTDLTKLTEQDIGETIAKIKLGNKTAYCFRALNDSVTAITSRGKTLQEYDPCNNPTDWEPLLEELRELGEVSIAEDVCSFISYRGLKPKITKNVWYEPKLGKAICLLWLMVKGE